MPIKKAPETVTTKTGVAIETNYCRKCMKPLPVKEFHECVDAGFIDSNGLMSVCKNCTQDIYDEVFKETQSIEKTIHKMCVSLNTKYSNDAVEALKKQIFTLQESGKNVNAIWGVYKQKLTSTKKSMDKSGLEDMTYEDVATVFTSEELNIKKLPIPQSVRDFWADEEDTLKDEDIRFLEKKYASFNQGNATLPFNEVVLLQEVCFTMLKIKKLRANNDETEDAVTELQKLMKSLNITPGDNTTTSKEDEAFGLWIRDIEMYEPAQWLLSDPRGDIYRDVGNTEEYFQKFTTRPAKNFITGSRDFNTENEDFEDDEVNMSDEDANKFSLINDGTGEDD